MLIYRRLILSNEDILHDSTTYQPISMPLHLRSLHYRRCQINMLLQMLVVEGGGLRREGDLG
jgi:hypothetical protein